MLIFKIEDQFILHIEVFKNIHMYINPIIIEHRVRITNIVYVFNARYVYTYIRKRRTRGIDYRFRCK